ncbi:thioredoxin reductase, putative [Ixodes scapularis]|uniref:Thioredoxin reductase, putative n=1 Tax=Ixodes scapularis TaxID=6945 RepID=B7PR82_IXOSC|nr:thioredoxin reductase, putative [Ixodes scapularis]|eukprot:XP_002436274.1 thioredoxin reductase, putative [Ixodes scapularis]
MPPIQNGTNLSETIEKIVKSNTVVIFSLSDDPVCKQRDGRIDVWGAGCDPRGMHTRLLPLCCSNVAVEESLLRIPPSRQCSSGSPSGASSDAEEYGPPLQDALSQRTGVSGLPQVFVGGEFLGGSEDTAVAYAKGNLGNLLAGLSDYDYDLVVIGGGSGGLAASKVTDKKGKEKFITASDFILAMGERPKYPDIPGAREYAITSDDLFFLPHCPGKTLVVGASYVALECAGFLKAMGMDVTVMVRSILLRGFDQDMAERIGTYMAEEGIRFIRPCVPTKLERVEEGSPGRIVVTADADGKELVEEYNTVLFAVGRESCTRGIGLEKVGVEVNLKSGKVPAVAERTSVNHIFAVGDVLDGRPELTPVAIQAGTLLARRLYGGSDVQVGGPSHSLCLSFLLGTF